MYKHAYVTSIMLTGYNAILRSKQASNKNKKLQTTTIAVLASLLSDLAQYSRLGESGFNPKHNTDQSMHWNVHVYTKRTVVMICRTKDGLKMIFPPFYLSGEELEGANATTYLEHILS